MNDEFFQKLRQNEDVLKGLGSPDVAMNKVDQARGTIPGQTDPSLQNLTSADLALLDRQGWGEQTQKNYGTIPALASGIPIAAYEGWKGLGSPGSGIVGKGLQALGYGEEKDMQPTERTSPASFGNIAAYFRGALGRDFFNR